MENIKKEIREVVEDCEISGLEILVLLETLEENVKHLIEDYKDWRETIQELLEEGCEGSWDCGEQKVQEDFLDYCCGNYSNNTIIKNLVNYEELSYCDTLDIMCRIMSTLESYYYYNYN